MGIATEVLFCLWQMCSNVLGGHCPWQVPFTLLRSGVSMFTVHALWHSVCVRRLCFRILSQFSSVFARFTSVPTTVLPTRYMRHWILSGLGALPWLDLCVWTELQLLLSCSVFGNTFLNAGLPWLGRVIVLEFVLVDPCLGLCDVCVCLLLSVHLDVFLQ